MVQALRQKVIVQPGGHIEIYAPELPSGANAEIIVLFDQQNGEARAQSPLSGLIGAGKGLYGSVKEIDDFIRAERDSWQT